MLAIVVVPRSRSSPRSVWRRLQWSVRGLLGLTTVCAVVLAAVLAPRIRERATIDWLESQHARYRADAFGPNWLRKLIGDRYLVHVIWADLRKCDVTDADLSRLTRLPRLNALSLRGSPVTVDGVERISSRLRAVWVDVLPADSLYRIVRIVKVPSGLNYPGLTSTSLSEAILEIQLAARCKMAWADSRGSRSDQLAVRRQFLHALERLSAEIADADGEPATPVERIMLDTAIAEARVELTSVSGSLAGIEISRRDSTAAAEQLVQGLDDAIDTAVDPLVFVAARELATRLLLQRRSNDAAPADAVDVLACAAEQAQLLRERTEKRCRADSSQRALADMAICKVELALARAHLARVRGDKDAELRAVQRATDDAAELREAVIGAYNPFSTTVFNSMLAYRLANDLERAQAEAQGIADAKQAARDKWAAWLAEKRQFTACNSLAALIVSCFSLLAEYERQGAAIFDRPLAELPIAQS